MLKKKKSAQALIDEFNAWEAERQRRVAGVWAIHIMFDRLIADGLLKELEGETDPRLWR